MTTEVTSGVAVVSTSVSADSAAAAEPASTVTSTKVVSGNAFAVSDSSLEWTFAACAAAGNQRLSRYTTAAVRVTCPRVSTSQKAEAFSVVRLAAGSSPTFADTS